MEKILALVEKHADDPRVGAVVRPLWVMIELHKKGLASDVDLDNHVAYVLTRLTDLLRDAA